MPMPEPSRANHYQVEHARLLWSSFERVVGRSLLDPASSDEELARQLYEAPFAVLSHGAGPDPVFDYGNRAAQVLFEMSWAELTALPSRLSAEPAHQAERERLLGAVGREGFIDDYRGVRVSRTGRRFRIERAVVWNLIDERGVYRGQAATFAEWAELPVT